MAIKDWSTTAASNNTASPNGFPEGMAPSGVNDSAREVMAQIRGWYEDPAWINYGYTYTYVGATQFKISGQDQTAKYVVGRRVRAVGSSTGTIYGLISVSSFSTDTTITVVWDSGTLSNETLQVSLGLPSLGKPIPYAALGLTGLVALADLVTAAQSTIMGRAAGAGTGTRTDLTVAQVGAILGGKQTIWVPASAMLPRTTNGAAFGTTESATNKVMLKTLDFDQTTQEFAQFVVGMPKAWNESTVTAQFVWKATGGNGTASFGIAGLALSDTDTIDTAFGTAVQATADDDGTTGTIRITAETSAVTIGNTPAAQDLVVFQVNRAPASDDLTADAQLIGVFLYITNDAINDT